MSIIRHHHDRNFVILPNELIQNQELSIKDIGLLCYMLSLPDQWEFSLSGLTSVLKHDGRCTISGSVHRLEKAGYIRRSYLRGPDGAIRGCVWEVSDAQEFKDDKPSLKSGNLTEENVTKENLISENPSQLKNIINKEHKEKSTHTVPVSFSPPDIEEVRVYCAQRRSCVDPEYFFDYYTANGWVQGKGKPVKDWKACLRTWERNGIEPAGEDNVQKPRWISTGTDEYGDPVGYWEGI